MSTVPTVDGQFGQALAFAERSLTVILHEHVAEHDITPQMWYTLQPFAADRRRRSLREHVSGPTVALLSQVRLRDVETADRTLQASTAGQPEHDRALCPAWAAI